MSMQKEGFCRWEIISFQRLCQQSLYHKHRSLGSITFSGMAQRLRKLGTMEGTEWGVNINHTTFACHVELLVFDLLVINSEHSFHRNWRRQRFDATSPRPTHRNWPSPDLHSDNLGRQLSNQVMMTLLIDPAASLWLDKLQVRDRLRDCLFHSWLSEPARFKPWRWEPII